MANSTRIPDNHKVGISGVRGRLFIWESLLLDCARLKTEGKFDDFRQFAGAQKCVGAMGGPLVKIDP